MSNLPNCSQCRKELDEKNSAILIPPANISVDVTQHLYVCNECWGSLQFVDNNKWVSISEALPFDEYMPEQSICGTFGDILVCGVWDEDEPPPNSYTWAVGYTTGVGWHKLYQTGKPLPYADKITHWRYMPDVHPDSGRTREPRKTGTIFEAKRLMGYMSKTFGDVVKTIVTENTPSAMTDVANEIQLISDKLKAMEIELETLMYQEAEDTQ